MRTRWPLLVLIALAVVTRVLFAVEVVARDAGLERAAPLDPWFYAQAGAQVRAGDLDLSEFQTQLKARIAKGERSLGFSTFLLSPEGNALYHRLYGERPILGGLLYPHLVGTSLLLTGSLYGLRILQIVVLGLLTLWLTYLLALRLTGDRRVALLAFALLALHTPSLAYGAFLLKPTLITLLLLGLIVAAERTASAPSPAAAIGLGACLALLHLIKGIALLVAPLVVLALLIGPRERRLQRAGLVLAGFMLVAAPLMVRNVRAGSDLLHTSSQGHVGLVAYHFEGADGLHLVRPHHAYVADVLNRSGASSLSTLREAIRTHPHSGSWQALELRKLRGFFNAYEAPNNVAIETFPLWLRSLSLAPLPSSALLVLGLAGLVLTLPRWRPLGFVLAGLGLVLLTCLVTISLSRYRLPAFPYLAILAAVGLRETWRATRSRQALALGIAVCAAALVLWPIGRPALPADQRLATLAATYAQQQKLTTALAITRRAVALHPYAASPTPPPGRDTRREIELIGLYELQASLETAQGDREAAAATWRALQRRYPTSARVAERLRALQDARE